MAIQRVPDSSPAAAASLLQGEAPRLIFKHSPTCGISNRAFTEVSVFADAHPDLPILLVDVLAQRGLSQQIALELHLAHESPQVILVADSRVLWSASHRGVTSAEIARALGALPPPRP
jgi:bacillithiol system protein YtxJ